MIILITGASHTGKTVLAQKILEKYRYPYLSLDHLKMGLIRSGYTDLTPEDDRGLEQYLWPIVREIIKTAIENRQNLVIEGCYIPAGWESDFSEQYLEKIRCICLVMSRNYIEQHFDEIINHANEIEHRLDDAGCTMDSVLKENAYYSGICRKYGYRQILIDERYQVEADVLEEREIRTGREEETCR